MTDPALLQGCSILVIEDDYLVAVTLAELLEDGGAIVQGPIGWRDEALSYVGDKYQTLDLVVLDVNLHGQVSYPVADALVGHGIPFVFMTGYGEGVLDEAYRGYPRCEKPFQREELFNVLRGLKARIAEWN